MYCGILILNNGINFVLKLRVISFKCVGKEREYVIKFNGINTIKLFWFRRNKLNKAQHPVVFNDGSQYAAFYILFK